MGNPLRVLIVEDSEDDARLLLYKLRQGGYEPTFERVETAEAMNEALDKQIWDVVIADYVMPEFSGLAALELLKKKDIDLPFIVVSGLIGEGTAVDAMTAGAHDYVLKDNLARLLPAIERELREAQVRRARREAEEALRKAHAELEIRVKERTTELEDANSKLQIEIAERKRAEEERERLLEEVREINSRLAVSTIQAKEQAEEAERRAAELDATLAAITSGIVIYSPDRSVLRLNAAAERMLGFTKEEWDAMAYPERVHAVRMSTPAGQIIAPEQTPMSLALRGQSFPDCRLIITRRGGTSIHVVISAGPIRDRQGQIIGAVGNMIDVTRLVQLQEQAEQRAAELSATITSMAEGVGVYNPRGEMIQINPALDTIFGLTAKQRELPMAERVKLLRPTTPEGQPLRGEEWPFPRALRGETVHGQVVVLHRPDGKVVWVSLSAAPILVGSKLTGVVVVFTDITAVHELQRQREEIINIVSHDLRQPLQIIRGQAQIIGRYVDKAEVVRKSVEAILSGSKRMNAMIQDLVDTARLEAGQLPLERKAVQLQPFISDLLDRARVVLDVGRIKVEIPMDLPALSADPDRLERIMLNLLTNALKYSPPGLDVVVRAKRTNGEVMVSVTDRGVGIAPEDLPHLFGRYYRAKGVQKVEGLGLGLYITKMLVEAHGGRIWVESEVEKGTTFYFSVPMG